MVPSNSPTPSPPPAECECIGGAARRAHVLSGSYDQNTVVLDTGAFFSGSGQFYAAFAGNASAEFFARSKYSAFGLTYRDFSAGGADGLVRYLSRAKELNPDLPKAVVTNMNTSAGSGLPFALAAHIEPYTILTLAGGKKMAVLSLTDPTHLIPSIPELGARLEVDFWRSLSVQLSYLRWKEAPDVIAVMITDLPVTAEEVARQGGKSTSAKQLAFSRLVNEAVDVDIFVLGSVLEEGAAPYVLRNWAGRQALVLPRLVENGRHIHQVTVTLSNSGGLGYTLVDATSQNPMRSLSLNCLEPEEPAAAVTLADFHEQMVTLLGVTVGQVTNSLDYHRKAAAGDCANIISGTSTAAVCGCRVSSCPQGALVADAARWASGAQVGLINGGSIGATVPAGTVTKAHIVTMLPFNNDVYVLTMSGATLRAALENGFSRLGHASAAFSPNGRFPQVSNMEVHWHYQDRAPRLSSVMIGTGANAVLLNDTHTYTVATTSYVANGGDGYEMFGDGGQAADGVTWRKLGTSVSEATRNYLQSKSPLTQTYTGRIIQDPDKIVLQIGLLCKGDNASATYVDPTEREECDHMHFLVDLINDKTDGFLDNMLPNAVVQLAEANAGCVEHKSQAAVRTLQRMLPQMISAVGIGCSNDVRDTSSLEFRAEQVDGLPKWDGVIVSGSSTAPGLDDEVNHPNVARLATGEVTGGGPGNSRLAKYFSWFRVAVLHDDSVWSTGAAKAFIAQHEGSDNGRPGTVINKDDTCPEESSQPCSRTMGFNGAALCDGTIDPMELLRRLDKVYKARVVYMLANPCSQEKLWSAIGKNDMMRLGYGWINGWITESAMRSQVTGEVSPDAVRGSEGAIGMLESYQAPPQDLHEMFRAKYAGVADLAGCSDTRTYCDVDDGGADVMSPGYAMGMAESMLLVLKAYDDNGNYMDASFRQDPDRLYRTMKQISQSPGYDGVSGKVILDDNGDRLGSFQIKNFQVTTSRRARQLRATRESRHLAVPLSASSAEYMQVGNWAPRGAVEFLGLPIVFPGGTSVIPSDTLNSGDDLGWLAGLIGGLVGGLLGFTLVAILAQRCFFSRKIQTLKSQVDALSEEMTGVRVVVVDFDPRTDAGFAHRLMWTSPPPSPPEAQAGASISEVAERAGVSAHHEPDQEALALASPADIENQYDLRQHAPNGACMGATEHPEDLELAARWFWQEQPQHMDKHHRRDIMQPGNFVAYAGMVCKELDQHFRAFLTGTGPRVVTVDLNDRIGSTGVEAKAYNAKTGSRFNVDFGAMVQLNEQTGFARKILRKELPKARAVKKAERAVKKRAKGAGNTLTIPADIQGDLLIMHKDQMLQTSQIREDGWAYGNVMYDPDTDRHQRKSDDVTSNGVSNMSGWFNMARTEPPTAKQMETFAKLFDSGGGTMDLTPKHWKMAEQSKEKVQFVPLRDGPEKRGVLDRVYRTQDSTGIKILEVERIENLPMWQTYVIKRQTMASRESGGNPDINASPRDKSERILYHGTGKDTVLKICQQGFNRSFAGTRVGMKYGQGCYFARDAAYSINYSRNGEEKGDEMYLLCVRVAVGTYVKGTQDMIQPPPRNENQLHDSTVDKEQNPTIFVTYHDAQAYPEYLIKFKERN